MTRLSFAFTCLVALMVGMLVAHVFGTPPPDVVGGIIPDPIQPALDAEIGNAPGSEVDVTPHEPFKELSTISGIVAMTLLIVELLKRWFEHVSFVKNVPNWAFTIVVACALTYFANEVVHSIEGNLGALMWDAGLAASSASGIYSWLKQPKDAPANRSE